MVRTRLPRRVTGVLCLDFVNTADYRATNHPAEYLVDAGVLVDWAVDAGAVDAELAAGIHAWVGEHLEEAERRLAGLLARREALYRVLRARLPAGRPATARDLRLVAGWVAAAHAHAVLVPGRPRWRWERCRRFRWPVAWSVARVKPLPTGCPMTQSVELCDQAVTSCSQLWTRQLRLPEPDRTTGSLPSWSPPSQTKATAVITPPRATSTRARRPSRRSRSMRTATPTTMASQTVRRLSTRQNSSSRTLTHRIQRSRSRRIQVQAVTAAVLGSSPLVSAAALARALARAAALVLPPRRRSS